MTPDHVLASPPLLAQACVEAPNLSRKSVGIDSCEKADLQDGGFPRLIWLGICCKKIVDIALLISKLLHAIWPFFPDATGVSMSM